MRATRKICGSPPATRRILLARIQIRYQTIPIVFADSRKFAEEWTYRFLTAALEDLAG